MMQVWIGYEMSLNDKPSTDTRHTFIKYMYIIYLSIYLHGIKYYNAKVIPFKFFL